MSLNSLTNSARYFALLDERGEFANDKGVGIKILTRRDAIRTAQDAAARHRLSHNLDASDLRVGMLASDPYMTIVRDAVQFMDGSYGLYNRILETPSVAVLPLLDGQPVLVRIFRHGLRKWSLEFPRGGREPDESAEMAAHRELHEEIGANTDKLQSLGEFTPGGSSLAIRAHFFAAKIDSVGEPHLADGISKIVPTPVVELERLVRDGTIIDGFTLSLFLKARLARIV